MYQFGLLCHDTLALCTYHSTGTKLRSLSALDDSYLMGAPYDFRSTRAYAFLEALFKRKYGAAFEAYLAGHTSGLPTWAEYHLVSLVPFSPGSLLENREALFVFMPDLHLHYFKGSLLDNFVTYFDNEWEGDRPVEKPHPDGRASMEHDMGVFVETVTHVKQSMTDKSRLRLVNLGDTTEMWETSAVAAAHCIKKDAGSTFSLLGTLLREVASDLARGNHEPEMRGLLEELAGLRLEELPLDPVLQSQIDALNAEPNLETAKKLVIFEDTEDEIRRVGEYIEREVLGKYRGSPGTTFADYLKLIKQKLVFTGNHDNYLSLRSIEPLETIGFAHQGSLGSPIYAHESAALTFEHRHQFDKFNNNSACGLGMMVTYFLTFLEAKRRGGLLKRAEGLVRGSRWRDALVRDLCRTFTAWDREDYASKIKVAVLGHTHVPVLIDISNEYAVYSTVKHALDRTTHPPAPKKPKWWQF